MITSCDKKFVPFSPSVTLQICQCQAHEDGGNNKMAQLYTLFVNSVAMHHEPTRLSLEEVSQKKRTSRQRRHSRQVALALFS